jgi:transposase
MTAAYSQDLRNRVIDAVENEGMSRRAAARRFGVSHSAAIKWLQSVERTGSRKPGRGRPPTFCAQAAPFIQAALAHKPDTTLEALCRRLLAECGAKADTWRAHCASGTAWMRREAAGSVRRRTSGHGIA